MLLFQSNYLEILQKDNLVPSVSLSYCEKMLWGRGWQKERHRITIRILLRHDPPNFCPSKSMFKWKYGNFNCHVTLHDHVAKRPAWLQYMENVLFNTKFCLHIYLHKETSCEILYILVVLYPWCSIYYFHIYEEAYMTNLIFK